MSTFDPFAPPPAATPADPERRPPTGAVTLHPNLATLAVRYQDIYTLCQRGQISVIDANNQIAQLRARDDEGVLWAINPKDGGWMYQSRTGEMMPGHPPTSGYATMTAHDFAGTGGAASADPRDQLRLSEVPDPPAGSGLAGSTRHAAAVEHAAATPGRLSRLVESATGGSNRRKALVVAAGAVAVVAVMLLFGMFRSGTKTAPPADPTTPSTVVIDDTPITIEGS